MRISIDPKVETPLYLPSVFQRTETTLIQQIGSVSWVICYEVGDERWER